MDFTEFSLDVTAKGRGSGRLMQLVFIHILNGRLPRLAAASVDQFRPVTHDGKRKH